MSAKHGIRNVGQLREMIVDAMAAVRDGQMDLDKASRLTKLAAQVNESFYSEIKVARVRAEAGESMPALGTMPIGSTEV
jgi:hypothetical protein